MSSQTTVVTSSSGRAAARKKSLTKFVANKRFKRAAALASKRTSSDVLRLPKGWNQTILPERYVTTIKSSMQFYIAASGIDQTNGNYMSISPNNIVGPYSTTYQAASVSPAYSMNGTYVQGYSASQLPIGYTFLATNYTKYKVLGYNLKVQVMTGTNLDVIQACIFPCGSSQIPSTSSGNVNMSVLQGQPKARMKIMSASAGGAENTLMLKGSVHELLGMRKQQWLDQDGTAFGAGPAIPGYLGFYIQSLNGSTNNQQVCVSIILSTVVEVTDLNNNNFLN